MSMLFFCLVEFFRLVTYNVLELCFGRFETVVCRNINNKDKCLMDFCKEKINNFREATLFAKAVAPAKDNYFRFANVY